MIIQNTAAVPANLPAEAAGVQQGGGNGAFAQLLMALFGNGMDGTMGQMLQADGDDGKKENTDAMQMLAELLGMNMPFQQVPDLLGGASQELLASGADVSALAGLLQGPVPGQAGVETLPENVLNFLAALQTAEAGEEQQAQAGLPVLQAEGAQDGDTADSFQADLFDGQMKFRQSVLEAQKALDSEKQKKPEEAQAIDISALQQRADASRSASAQKASSAGTHNSADVVKQVKDNILQTLNDGKDEFTVRLKPESLGEITVKMTRDEDGHISMSILTASAQTAKLLNETVDALKASLRPLQAEVREIVARPEQPAESQQSGFFGSGFENFQHQNQYTNEQPKYYGRAGEGSADYADTAEEAEEAAPGGVTAYI